ncbi:MAG: transcription termination factor Rho [Phycisphaerae bacterium]|nr:transcription termination factor Rho [Phycisphaerae bacterium]
MPESIVDGTLELQEKGGGFLRSPRRNYAVHPTDAFVPDSMIKRWHLRGGEAVSGIGGVNGHGGRSRLVLSSLQSINGLEPAAYAELTDFADLTVIDPTSRLRFEMPGGSLSMRVVDLMTPIGLGQRGLIAAPPRTGKTVLLQQMAAGLAANHPDVYMMVLLVDERPEEVTEMRRTVHGEVVSSSNDQSVASHIRIARLMIEKAKRMVETGQNVFILLDSLTRLGRAYNAGIRSSGRTMSGGIDIRALAEPKAIFGSARNIEHGGSLTIMASALIETGSRMDEVIFNEFKGTGNMEIMLSRDLANLRIWPAIDLNQSGTRKEELLLGKDTTEKTYRIRRQICTQPPNKAMEMLLDSLRKFPSNQAFLDSMPL